MYTVVKKHYKPFYRKGDLEDTFEIISANTFTRKKDAKDFIENELKNKIRAVRKYKTGYEVSKCYYPLGKTWTHENTGEVLEEYIIFELTKIK